ncbi:MAG: hypothetical protein JWL96_4190 [Sphingomonas bacterium]|uniref:DUF924 family protein n=1 Tax=Sphingomonas bacterium TaxID=1895847 RepID=UPI00261CC2B1|nr:DUF924 family protein [Sphingomonas bacterium]MDB5712120.1 hypothetical protein [Sphingomonas bacterium]
MGGDLGAGQDEVHVRAVLDFWFGEVPPEKRFAKDAALDDEIARRFGGLRDEVLASDATGWRNGPDTMLAAIIMLDQFSRNIHRETAEAFAADPLAVALTKEAIARGWDEAIDAERRAFLYMPLMHAEDAAAQRESVACFTCLGNAENLDFARAHEAVIEKFGRFPSRNAALGRQSTPEELTYLSQPGAGW